MKSQRDTSLRIRLAGIAIISLFIALGAAAYFSGEQVKRDSDLITTDAVPGTIAAHKMRMDMSRSTGWVLVAASAQTTQSRDASLKIAHLADVAFTNDVTQYKATIVINPAKDQALLEQTISAYAKYYQQRMIYESLILAGNHDGSAAFLETNLVPVYVLAINSAEKLLDYNNTNSITYANHIHNSVHHLYLAVAVVMLLALVCASVLIMNLSIRRRELIELRESEQKYRDIVEQSPLGIFQSSVKGPLISVNSSLAAMFGYDTPEQMINDNEDPTRRYARTEQRQEIVRAVSESSVSIQREVESRRKDGTIFPTNLFIRTVRAADGTIQYLEGFIEDISVRKRSQDELIWKTALLEAQVDSTLDGILVVDTMGKKILQNQRFLEMFKVPEEIARDNDDVNMLQHAANQMKKPKQFKDRVIYLYGHPNEIGREEIELTDGRIFDRYSSPVRDKAGKHFGRIWAFRDMTDQRKLEEQFRQSQKMEAVGQLASGVAHDFNNILGIIQMQSELMKMKGGLSPEQSELAVEIGVATQRAAALTRQLLLFSRKEKMQMRELDLNQSVNDMTKMLRRTLGGGVELQFKFAMQQLFVNADPGMMDQVLMNLAVNARDAMPNGGKLIIGTSVMEIDEMSKVLFPQSRTGSYVCLSVSDSGTGIPPEILPKIFEPFFTTKDVGKGTGLGLATVFGIVQQHQGWINVYSEAGQGTTFRIYLPRLARISDQKFVSPVTEPLPGGNETILIVEDEPKLRASVRNVLSGLGYNVLEAADGVGALEVWKQNRDKIQLLLTDMVMPGGMTGKDLGEHLLQDNPKLKVIYASGYSAEVAAKDLPLQEGVNFLTKPFQANNLAKAIRNLLNG